MKDLAHAVAVFKDTLARSRQLRATCLSVLITLVVVGGAAIALSRVPDMVSADHEETRATQAATEAAEPDASQREPTAPESEADPEGQDAAEQKYSGAEQGLLDTLMSCSWTNREGEVITWGPDEVTVRSSGASRSVSFELRNAEVGQAVGTTAKENGRTATFSTVETDFVLVWDGEPYSATLVATTSSEGTTYALECEPIGSMSGTTAASELALEGADGLDEATDGGEESLLEALRSWCSSNSPLATRATWGGSATRDYEAGTVSVELALNDEASTVVTAVRDLDKGSWKIS